MLSKYPRETKMGSSNHGFFFSFSFSSPQLTLTILSVLLLVLNAGISSAQRPSDFPNIRQYNAYFVIQRFKATITCDPMNVTGTWVGNRPCQYRGFYCDTPPNAPNTPTIASIDFNGFGLCAPTIAGFIDQLPDLALFHANSNNFSGTVPALTGLPFLYELDLSNNKLSGPFPANVLPLNNLFFLDLRFNSFAGAVPAPLFTLGLDVLFINNNQFRQGVPADLGSSPVAYLTLANNGFSGPIPPSIANASRTLLEVLFLNNELCGCLPSEIGYLRSATVFDAGSNFLTGQIPPSFACLRRVQQLNLAWNLLYGGVPDAVCQLATVGRLANLSLSWNYFTYLGNSCYPLLANGVLDVRGNCIPGFPGQRPAAECAGFLAHPKYCPISTVVPCSTSTSTRRRAEGRHAARLAARPPATSRRAAASPTYMAYKAIHKQHR